MHLDLTLVTEKSRKNPGHGQDLTKASPWPKWKGSSNTLFPLYPPTHLWVNGPGVPLGDSTCVLTVLFIAVVRTVVLPITTPGQTDAAA